MLKIGSFEFPDKCPGECQFREDLALYGQGSICIRCPVFVCGESVVDGESVRLVEPDDYRLDWASEWVEFFESGKRPVLPLAATKGK